MISACGTELPSRVQSSPLSVGQEYIIAGTPYKIKQVSIDCNQGFNSPAVLAVFKDNVQIGSGTFISSGTTNYQFDSGQLCIALWFYDCQSTIPKITYDIYYGASGGKKAVEFGKFWADNMNDVTLKSISELLIIDVGSQIDAGVVRQDSKAYVVFTPNPTKYTQFNLIQGLYKVATAAFGWVKANPGKATLLLGALAYIAIRVIDWQTKAVEKEIQLSEDATIKSILDNPNLTPEQKIALIEEYLKKKTGTDWNKIVEELGIFGVVIFGLYIISKKV